MYHITNIKSHSRQWLSLKFIGIHPFYQPSVGKLRQRYHPCTFQAMPNINLDMHAFVIFIEVEILQDGRDSNTSALKFLSTFKMLIQSHQRIHREAGGCLEKQKTRTNKQRLRTVLVHLLMDASSKGGAWPWHGIGINESIAAKIRLAN